MPETPRSNWQSSRAKRDRRATVALYLTAARGTRSTRDVITHTGLGERTAQRYLTELQADGVVDRTGGKGQTAKWKFRGWSE